MTLRWKDGIASPGNLACLLGAFVLFPFIVKWTDTFAVARMDASDPPHTHAFVKFTIVVLLFEWLLFFIACFGVRYHGKTSVSELMGKNGATPRR